MINHCWAKGIFLTGCLICWSTPQHDYPCPSLPSSTQTYRRHYRVMTAARAWSCASRTSWVFTVAQTDYIQPLALGMTGDDSVEKPLRFQTCTHTCYPCDNWQLRG